MSDEIKYKAIQTYNQINAIRTKLDRNSIFNELVKRNKKLNRLKKVNGYNEVEVVKWIKNCWNTERILKATSSILSNDDNYFALQWSFPQIYYSIFCSAMAVSTVLGKGCKTHTGILKEVSNLVKTNYYPEPLSFYADNGFDNIIFKNIQKTSGYGVTSYSAQNPETVDNQICQFLNGTREYWLKEKKRITISDNKRKEIYNLSNGNPRSQYQQKHWDELSNELGPTTFIHLLYRKRIKANYLDIDTFDYEKIKAQEIHADLVHIVDYINLIHETFIFKAVGKNKLIEFKDAFVKSQSATFVDKRINEIITNMGSA